MPAFPWLALGAGAGLGLLKNILGDAPQAARERTLAGEQTRYAPWTGVKPITPSRPNAFNSMLQGGTSGLMFAALNKQLGGLGGGAEAPGTLPVKNIQPLPAEDMAPGAAPAPRAPAGLMMPGFDGLNGTATTMMQPGGGAGIGMWDALLKRSNPWG